MKKKSLSHLIKIVPPMLLSCSAFAQNLVCPTSDNGEAITKWRSEAVKAIVSGQYSDVSSKLKQCFGERNVSCLEDLKYYLEARRRGDSSTLYSDPDPYGSRPVEGYTIQSVEDLPKEFRAATDRVKLPDNLEQVSKSNGWKAVSYKTRSTGGFDTGPNLTLVAIPGNEKDVYLQISPPRKEHVNFFDPKPEIAGDNPSKGQKVLTIITVDKTKNPPVGQLRLLTQGPDGNYVWNNKLRAQQCIECHSSPLRTISPVGYQTTVQGEGKMNPRDQKTVQEINEMMVGALSWGAVKTSAGVEVRRGPAMESQPYGWAPQNSSTRSNDYLRSCSQNKKTYSYQSITGPGTFTVQSTMSDSMSLDLNKVKNAMNCNYCHNGNVRGTLHKGFSFDEMTFKILVDRSMPPGEDLNTNERIALLNCLRAEYRDVSSQWDKSGEWMTRMACTGGGGTLGQTSSSGAGSSRLRKVQINQSVYQPSAAENRPIRLGGQQ